MKKRCDWAGTDPDYIAYHDCEWGVPVHDDRLLFEFLCLEGAQAGLSWLTILKKRKAYRNAFDNFDPEKVAAYDQRRIDRLLNNKGIVRNRKKVEAAIVNARAFLTVAESCGSFDDYLWQFVDGRPVKNQWRTIREVPAQSPVSQAMSKDMKKRGFKFVGPVICYSLMQAVGLVNDHLVNCFRYNEL